MTDLTHAEICARGGRRAQELHGPRIQRAAQKAARSKVDAQADLTGVDLDDPEAVARAIREHRRRYFSAIGRAGVAAKRAKRAARLAAMNGR